MGVLWEYLKLDVYSHELRTLDKLKEQSEIRSDCNRWRDDDSWDDWFYAKTGKLHSGESNAMHARSTYTELIVSCIKSTINYCILNLVYDTVELSAALAVSLKIKYQYIKKH